MYSSQLGLGPKNFGMYLYALFIIFTVKSLFSGVFCWGLIISVEEEKSNYCTVFSHGLLKKTLIKGEFIIMLNIINNYFEKGFKILLGLNCPANRLNFEREKNLTGNSPDLLKVF